MSGTIILLASIVFFLLGYRFWGKRTANWLGIDPQRPTPAHTHTDGVDYVPTRPSVLLGHHFSSIAGAAPIIGPIAAASWGAWSVFAWIVIGGVFMGAVHDFSSLVVSVRHEGRGLGSVLEERLGRGMKTLFLLFVFFALILVIAVFTNAVAKTFVSVPETATASMLFIFLAVGFGLSIYRFHVPFAVATPIGVMLLAACMIVGYFFPLSLSFQTWRILLIIYIFIASTTPVQYLLQPRDFLSSFILYAMLAVLIVGITIANPPLRMTTMPVWNPGKGPLFPLLFVTVACGALSGFHSLVASGTTSKQLDNEAHAQPIGYGAMLIESLLAVAALITASVLTPTEYKSGIENPIHLFATSAASLSASVGLPVKFGTLFMSLSVAAFAMTSLDTATRLGRYALQELADIPRFRPAVLLQNRFFATGITVIVASLLIFSGSATEIWPIFGAANQLVASLAFLTIAIWLTFLRRPRAFVLIPGVFVYGMTLTALAWNVYDFGHKGKAMLASIAAFLFLLATVLGISGAQTLLRKKHVTPMGSQ